MKFVYDNKRLTPLTHQQPTTSLITYGGFFPLVGGCAASLFYNVITAILLFCILTLAPLTIFQYHSAIAPRFITQQHLLLAPS